MITRGQLQAAIDVCGWACPECGSDEITPMWDGEWIPDTGHWQLAAAPRRGLRAVAARWLRRRAPDRHWCPALEAGSAAMLRCWLDVNDTLAAAGLPVPDYGAQAAFSKREVTA